MEEWRLARLDIAQLELASAKPSEQSGDGRQMVA